MIFDDFVSVSKFCPDLKQYLRRARIFHFPAYAREFVPTEISDEEVVFLKENFFLPFPCLAVEDKTSCVLIWDDKQTKKEIPTGIDRKRFFAECLPAGNLDPAAYRADEEELIKGAPDIPELKGAFLISWGHVEHFRIVNNKEELVGGRFAGGLLVNKHEVLFEFQAESGLTQQQFTEGFLKNCKTALEEVTYMNSPSRFILEKRPLQVRQHRNKRRIPRSNERPVYTLMTPKEIRTEMRLPPVSSGGARSPHERRRHVRKYRDARFSERVRNKTYIIPATWVGPSETRFDGHRYKVMLDL